MQRARSKAMSLYFTPTPNPSPQGGGGSVRLGDKLARCASAQRNGSNVKFTLAWLKDHLDTSAPVAELAEKLALIGLDVESVDDPAAKLEGLHHRPRGRGQAPSQRRQAAGVQGRHRLRRGRGGVRRPQRQDRHDRRVRAHRQLHPRHRDHAGGASPCAASSPRACWCRSGSWSCPTTTRASSSWRPSWRARSASATPTSWASPIPSSR